MTKTSSTPMNAVLVGAGHRSRFAFGAYAQKFPSRLKFVAVAEPDDARRARFAQEHAIPASRQFRSWEDLVAVGEPLAPLAFNCTMDRDHLESGVALLRAGHDLMLEKPMADTPEGCVQVAQVALELGRYLQISHPMRFTSFYREVKRLLDAGAVGRVLALNMTENIGYYHYAHSYVRGNWRRVAESGPLILTKCCHDMDAATWITDSLVKEVSAMGGLYHFRSENAPAGAPKRCTDGCPVEATCPYHAPSLYLQPGANGFAAAISVDTSVEARRRALEAGPYGRCVFHCDNDAADQHSVMAQFQNGVLLDFTVYSNTPDISRQIRVIGSEGELTGHFEKSEIQVLRYKGGPGEEFDATLHHPRPMGGGHMGGDEGVTENFLRIVAERDWESMRHSLENAVEGHLLSFAAEEARSTSARVHMDEFRRAVHERVAAALHAASAR